MITLFLVFVVVFIMLILWIPLANMGVQFTDGIGYTLFTIAILIILVPFVISILRAWKK